MLIFEIEIIKKKYVTKPYEKSSNRTFSKFLLRSKAHDIISYLTCSQISLLDFSSFFLYID